MGPQAEFLGDKVQDRLDWFTTVAGVVHKHPQTAYAGLQKSLQQECAFVQHSTQGLGYYFRPVAKALREEFLPALFLGAETHMPGRLITVFPVKNANLEITDPTLTSQGKWMASCAVTRLLVAAQSGHVKYRYGDHVQLLRDSCAYIRSWKAHEVGEALTTASMVLSQTDACRLRFG